MKLLLDTNVLIDFFGQRPSFCQDAQRLFIAQAFGDVQLWVSAKSFTDVFYVLKQPIGEQKLQAMFISSLERLNVCSIDGADIQAAAGKGWSDFEDALISVVAEKVGADCIVTRDLRGFGKSSIPTCSTTELLAQIKAEKGLEYDLIAL